MLYMSINYKFTQFQKALEIENQLGSPCIPNKLFSYSTFLKLDEEEKFPSSQADYLTSLNFQKNFLPCELGGFLSSFEELGYLFRCIYRRDITLGLGYGSTTFMAAVHILIAGSSLLKTKLSKVILNGSTISVGYHEKPHGNDLLNNEVFATPFSENTYQVNGSKWLINNASTSQAITAFVRTRNAGGPRGFSLFFIDKSDIREDEITYNQKIKTHGVKGCRIGGFQFQNTTISNQSLIGKEGDGFELTVKAFQLTRAVLPSMALGSVDTALRCCFQFAEERSLYGSSINQIPQVKETLVYSFINLLASDCLAITATRGLHVLPQQMSIISAIAKFQIPKLSNQILKKLAVIMGSRFYMREGAYGIFQKIIRDFAIVSLGHSSDVICLNSILPQLKSLLAKSQLSPDGKDAAIRISSLDLPLPIFIPEKLKLTNNGFNDIFNSLFCLDKLMNQISPNDRPQLFTTLLEGIQYCIQLAGELKNQSHFLNYQLKEFSLEHYLLGESYSKLFTLICCYLIWINNYKKISDFFDSGIWLVLILNSLFSFEKFSYEIYTELIHETFEYLQFLYSNHLSFSIVPISYP